MRTGPGANVEEDEVAERVPRIARLMALALKFEQMIRQETGHESRRRQIGHRLLGRFSALESELRSRLKQPGAASRNGEICVAVNHFASIRSRGWGANISLRKLVLRLNTDGMLRVRVLFLDIGDGQVQLLGLHDVPGWMQVLGDQEFLRTLMVLASDIETLCARMQARSSLPKQQWRELVRGIWIGQRCHRRQP